MCRLLGYVGAPRTIEDLAYGGRTSLEVQSYAPRHQAHGLVNADGWGVGWYVAGEPMPARYRTDRPMWADTSFRGIARHIASGHVLAEVRSATPPAPSEESGVAPFTDGPHLFVHNGLVEGFRDGVGTQLRRGLTPRREAGLLGAADSEVLFSLVLDRLDDGDDLATALRKVIAEVRTLAAGRFNLLASDGTRLVGTRAGDTLWRCTDDAGTRLASEPTDDDPGWSEVPDESLVVVTADGTEVEDL